MNQFETLFRSEVLPRLKNEPITMLLVVGGNLVIGSYENSTLLSPIKFKIGFEYVSNTSKCTKLVLRPSCSKSVMLFRLVVSDRACYRLHGENTVILASFSHPSQYSSTGTVHFYEKFQISMVQVC